MPAIVEHLRKYSDDLENSIEYDGPEGTAAKIVFRGSNNSLFVDKQAKIGHLEVNFDCNNAKCVILGTAAGIGSLKFYIRLGEDGTVHIGNSVTCTGNAFISAAEGATVKIGDDCMLAMGVTLRADDAHPIFDIHSGKRINPSRDIAIGNHVWLGQGSAILGGAVVGDGCVVGTGGVLKSAIPNNCIAVGVPAKVIRKDIAWERPHLTLSKPYYKADASTVKKSAYWNATIEATSPDVADH